MKSVLNQTEQKTPIGRILVKYSRAKLDSCYKEQQKLDAELEEKYGEARLAILEALRNSGILPEKITRDDVDHAEECAKERERLPR